MEWQPIETAPRDGTKILVCGGSVYSDAMDDVFTQNSDVAIAVWVVSGWVGEAEHHHDCWERHHPTHWMPLPEPPAALSQDAKTTDET